MHQRAGHLVVTHRGAGAGIGRRIGDRLLSAKWRSALADAVTAALAAHHDAQPLSDGVPRDPYRELPGGVLPAIDRAIELGVADPDRVAAP